MESRHVTLGDGTTLHVGSCGSGPDVVVLAGGPGCVQYLEDRDLAVPGARTWWVESLGVGRSTGGPHTMARAIADLEEIRASLGVPSWSVVGHSWGADLAVRYGLDHPGRVTAVLAVAGTGVQKDRTWSEEYHRLKDSQPHPHVEFDPGVHTALKESFIEWIHEATLLRRLADCPVPMTIVAAGEDVRPSWPLEQLAALLPHGRFVSVPGVPHDFWHSHPQVWRDTTGLSRWTAPEPGPAGGRPVSEQ